MKYRSQPFSCSIAGKAVGISLRHGGGLQEPDRIYVRCDERDCQYVDLNEPPCPLRVDMFADSSDGRVSKHLREHAGLRVCYACLTDVLDITHEQVRRASWQLRNETGFSIRPSRCAVCRQRRVTIGVTGEPVPAPPPATPGGAIDHETPAAAEAAGQKATTADPSLVALEAPSSEPAMDRVAGYLRDRPGYSFCTHCLARELGASATVVRDAMWDLDANPEFFGRTTQCVSCLLMKRTIRYEPGSGEAAAPRRVIEFLIQSPGLLFCATCVAFSSDVALVEARRVLGYLESLDEFIGKESACGVCGRWQAVIGLRERDDASSRRLESAGELFEGAVRYQGVRIQLLSFRTPAGWRPFALVKSAAGALVPDSPAIVLGLTPTKLEADELAAERAREWIDRHLPTSTSGSTRPRRWPGASAPG